MNLVKRFVWALGALAAGACTESASVSGLGGAGSLDERHGGPIEIFSWWTSGGELEALDALVELHESRVPGSQVMNAAVAFSDKARSQLVKRFGSGLPPDTFQTNAGASLAQWVITDGIGPEHSLVADLSRMFEGEGLESAFYPDVQEAVSVAGVPYAVPANVHRVNSLFFRPQALEALGLKVPQSLPELLEICRRVQTDEALRLASGASDLRCLGGGNRWGWVLPEITFEMLVPALSSGAFYESYFRGDEEALAPPILEALDIALRLYCGESSSAGCSGHGAFNSDLAELDWTGGMDKLRDGEVLFAPMGDWARGYLQSESGGLLEIGRDFEVIPFPGSAGSFVFAVDAFPLPLGATNERGARSFLCTLASTDGQLLFNHYKGSIPARRVPRDLLDESTVQLLDEFEAAERVGALSHLVNPAFGSRLAAELTASLQAGSLEIVRNFLLANYGAIKQMKAGVPSQ